MNYCHNCGEKLLNSPKFCGQCGIKINESSAPLKKESVQEKITTKPVTTEKSKGGYLYPILGGLVFVLIFGSRALWTAYKDNNFVDTHDSDITELLLDKNWMLKSYSNFTFTGNNDVWTQSDVEGQLNESIDDPVVYMRFKRSPQCKGDRIILYEQSIDETLGESSYGISVVKVSQKKGNHRLYRESNKIHSIGIGSYIDNTWEISDHTEKSIITEIDETTLKLTLHNYIETLDGAVWEWDIDVVYQAIEDGDESVMVKANHEITDDWKITDCNKYLITPKRGSRTYNELEAIDESYDFDLDFSEAEFDYDEL